MTGEVLGASKALAMGLISEALEEGRVSSRVNELARLLVSNDAQSSAMAKRVYRQILSMDYEQGVDFALDVLKGGLTGEERR